VEDRRLRLTAHRFLKTLLAALAAVLVLSGGAAAKVVTVTKTVTVSSGSPVLIQNQAERPPGFSLTARAAKRIAARVPLVIATLKDNPTAYPGTYTKGAGQWQVSWFTRAGKERSSRSTSATSPAR
jgi:hypothetical protein